MSDTSVFLVVIYVLLFISVEPRRLKHTKKSNIILFLSDSSNKLPISDLGIRYLGLKKVAEVQVENAFKCKEGLNDGLESLENFCKNAFGMNTAIIPQQTVEERIDYRSKIKKSRKRNNVITKDIIIGPEQSEVFKIRAKRNVTEFRSKQNDVIGAPVYPDKLQHPWDVLDVWTHVKYSFFGNLFKDKKLNDDNLIIPGKKDPGLFDLVQISLKNLLETQEPFLLVIFGGHLSEISEKYSSVVQILKHITENTEAENTLIILTGNCPEYRNFRRGVVEIKENVKESRKEKIPVYAKGPKSEKLSECIFLYDIPLVLKSNLEETSPIFDGNH